MPHSADDVEADHHEFARGGVRLVRVGLNDLNFRLAVDDELDKRNPVNG